VGGLDQGQKFRAGVLLVEDSLHGEVTVEECCFSTPRIIMQRWRASDDDAHTLGVDRLLNGVGNLPVSRSCTCKRRAKNLYQRAILLRPITFPLGM